MKFEKKYLSVTLRLDEELGKELVEMAKQAGMKKSALARVCIINQLAIFRKDSKIILSLRDLQ